MSPEVAPPCLAPGPIAHVGSEAREWEVLGVPVKCVTGAAMDNAARAGCRGVDRAVRSRDSSVSDTLGQS